VQHHGQRPGVQHPELLGRPGERDVQIVEPAVGFGQDAIRIGHDHPVEFQALRVPDGQHRDAVAQVLRPISWLCRVGGLVHRGGHRVPHGVRNDDRQCPVAGLGVVLCGQRRGHLRQISGIDLPVAVNLSGADVLDARLADDIAAALRRAGVPGDHLECEISEHTVLADPARAVESLSRLRAMGGRVSLDDFGQGQSSLSYLGRRPLDEIKIDRSFVMGMADDASDAAIVRATIDLGRGLGLQVVAEGVEDDEALAGLALLRCDVAQGFGLSRPLPADRLERWLAARAAARAGG